MCHFLIVNTTQKSVDAGVEQRIYARLNAATSFENVPSLPKWIRRIVESGDDEQALQLADYLNDTDGSPWYNKIKMANQEPNGGKTNQSSFVKLIKTHLLVPSNPICQKPMDQQKKILLNYWLALSHLLDDMRPTALYKYVGVNLFSRFATPLFNRLQTMEDFQTATMERILKETFAHLESEYVGVGHPDWWASKTGSAGGLNSTAIAKISHALTKAMHASQANANIII